MRKIIHVVVAVLIISAAYMVTMYLRDNAPEAKKKFAKARQLTTVTVSVLKSQSYSIKIHTTATVKTGTQTRLSPEISGRITKIAPHFSEGSFFDKGDVLLRIDSRNYRNAIAIAKAELSQKKLDLKQQQAQAKQALRDWQRLGETGEADELVMRKPQVAAAQASVDAAKARLAQAKIDLERTQLLAPYAGRVLQQAVDLGQYVSSATALGVIYATDAVEIRLPLSRQQMQYLTLPGRFKGDKNQFVSKVVLTAGQQRWPARLVRTEGSIDVKSRQQFVIAEVKSPYDKKYSEPLEIGRFVRAEITGKRLSNVFLIPRTAVRQANEVQVVIDGKLQRKTLKVLWSDEQQLIAAADQHLQSGALLVETPVSFIANGSAVTIAGQDEANAPKKTSVVDETTAAHGGH